MHPVWGIYNNDILGTMEELLRAARLSKKLLLGFYGGEGIELEN